LKDLNPLIKRGKVLLVGLKGSGPNGSSTQSVIVYRANSIEVMPRGSLFGINAILTSEDFQLRSDSNSTHEFVSALAVLYSGLEETLIDNHYFASRVGNASLDAENINELKQKCAMPSVECDGVRWKAKFWSVRESVGKSPVYHFEFYGSAHPFQIDGCRVESVFTTVVNQPPPR